ncbi:hypothetical protein TNCV_3093991 [Trichonephila clavipes]|nr:hypothetical protein TNCV_3093991 [Trichonephila clavipes]
MVREDTRALSEGATGAWNAANEAVGTFNVSHKHNRIAFGVIRHGIRTEALGLSTLANKTGLFVAKHFGQLPNALDRLN